MCLALLFSTATKKYTFQAWTRSSSGLLDNYIFARDFGGTTLMETVLANATWTKIRIENINVSNVQCTIGLYTRGNDLYSSMDNVVFFKQ